MMKLFAAKSHQLFLQKCPIKDVWQGRKWASAQPAFTCSNLTTEALEQNVKYVQS